MKKTQKALSIKKLQVELRDEMQAELKRLVITFAVLIPLSSDISFLKA